MNFIDQIYYINLDYRTDRRLQMEDWLDESGVPSEKVTRISAVHTPGRGHIGVGLSHIKALDEFLNSNHTVCAIFEDDYMPLRVSDFWKTVERIFTDKIAFDILACAYNELKSDPGPTDYLRKVNFSFTASGYILTREFAGKLRDNFIEAVTNIVNEEEQTRQKSNQYCIDVYWQKLMPVSKWYCFYPRIGKQRDGYSDIQQHYVDYIG